MQRVQRALFPEVKQLGCDVEPSPPSSVQANDTWNVIATLPLNFMTLRLVTVFYVTTQTWAPGVVAKFQLGTILCSSSQKTCKCARVHSMTLYQLHRLSERNDWGDKCHEHWTVKDVIYFNLPSYGKWCRWETKRNILGVPGRSESVTSRKKMD
jgi:hypothetical protein